MKCRRFSAAGVVHSTAEDRRRPLGDYADGRCERLLAFNYYSSNHHDPQINFVLDLALQSFSAGGLSDTFSAMEGRRGLLLIERRNGFVGGFDFEIHA